MRYFICTLIHMARKANVKIEENQYHKKFWLRQHFRSTHNLNCTYPGHTYTWWELDRFICCILIQLLKLIWNQSIRQQAVVNDEIRFNITARQFHRHDSYMDNSMHYHYIIGLILIESHIKAYITADTENGYHVRSHTNINW